MSVAAIEELESILKEHQERTKNQVEHVLCRLYS